MPVTDRVAMLRALCDSEICGWYGRVIARTILRSVAFRIVRETIARMEVTGTSIERVLTEIEIDSRLTTSGRTTGRENER